MNTMIFRELKYLMFKIIKCLLITPYLKVYELSSYSIKKIGYFLFFKNRSINEDLTSIDFFVVIARYNENLEWLRNVKFRYVVYNKGRNNLKGLSLVKNIPNIGRESHTYLHFIRSNYNNLPKRAAFIQADPFKHNPNILEDFKKYRLFLNVQPLSLYYAQAGDFILKNRMEFDFGIPRNDILRKFTVVQNGIRFYIERLNSYFATDWPYDYIDIGMQKAFVWEYGASFLSDLLLKLKIPKPDEVYFNYAGMFAVSREFINNHDEHFYDNLIEFLLEDNLNGHLFERLWLTIFQFDKKWIKEE